MCSTVFLIDDSLRGETPGRRCKDVVSLLGKVSDFGTVSRFGGATDFPTLSCLTVLSGLCRAAVLSALGLVAVLSGFAPSGCSTNRAGDGGAACWLAGSAAFRA